MSRPAYDSTKENWNGLFTHGTLVGRGGRIAHFHGVRPQHGAGIGGVLRSIFRLIPSFLSSPVGQNLVSAGANIVNDVNNGSSLKDSVKSHARASVRNLTGVGKRRQRRSKVQKGGGVIGEGRVPRAIGFIRGSAPKGSKKATPSKVIRRAFIR